MPDLYGAGNLRSVDSLVLALLRQLAEEACKPEIGFIEVQAPVDVAAYLLNEKRSALLEMENEYKLTIQVLPNRYMEVPNYKIQKNKRGRPDQMPSPVPSHKKVADLQIPVPEAAKTSASQQTPVTIEEPAVKALLAQASTPHPSRSSLLHRLWQVVFGGPLRARALRHPKQKQRRATPRRPKNPKNPQQRQDRGRRHHGHGSHHRRGHHPPRRNQEGGHQAGKRPPQAREGVSEPATASPPRQAHHQNQQRSQQAAPPTPRPSTPSPTASHLFQAALLPKLQTGRTSMYRFSPRQAKEAKQPKGVPLSNASARIATIEVVVIADVPGTVLGNPGHKEILTVPTLPRPLSPQTKKVPLKFLPIFPKIFY